MFVLYLCFSVSAVFGESPNIVCIVADDLGYGDLGCYGCSDILTPNIDRLAAEGVRFTQFYANAPECTPTRTALLSGRYQHRVGGLECAIGTGNYGRYDEAAVLSDAHDLGLPPSYGALPAILTGYKSACIGKWHLGYERQHWPDKHGFDFWIGPICGGVDYFHHTEPFGECQGNHLDGDHVLYKNGKEFFSKKYMTHLITDEAVEWLKKRSAKIPFFLYVPYTAPHSPYQGPNDRQPEKKGYLNWDKGDRATFAGMVEELDKGVGDICRSLDKQGLKENTVVIFFSDNGANKKGNNGELRGHKGSLFEGGIRVPCVIRQPAAIKPGIVSAQPCMSMDLTSSIASIAGVKAPDGKPFDGMDIINHVVNGKPTASRTLYWRARRGDRLQRAVRDGNIKYLYRAKGAKVAEYLFDLKADLSEKNNLINEQPEKAETMKIILEKWEQKVKNKRGVIENDK
ncbi:MAG: sulfatase-like hydrolase/transferase [Kiritimatiellae bacterium]|nr:sulfatase-like hydrolase/transferase [Kiritimatiellia bacterium]